MPRPDGYAWGPGTFQGARTFDSAAGTWTTPDAFGGDVRDPGSLKSYIWNGNNSVAYADPTGFDPISQGLDGSGGQSLFTDWSMTGTAGYDNPTFGNAMQLVPTPVAANAIPSIDGVDKTPNSSQAAQMGESASAAGMLQEAGKLPQSLGQANGPLAGMIEGWLVAEFENDNVAAVVTVQGETITAQGPGFSMAITVETVSSVIINASSYHYPSVTESFFMKDSQAGPLWFTQKTGQLPYPWFGNPTNMINWQDIPKNS